MNNGHMLIVIGAIVLFAFLVMSADASLFRSAQTVLASEYLSTATSFAQTLVDEVSTKKFDETTVSSSPKNTNALTDPGALGPEIGETFPNWDDVDDFNGSRRVFTSPRTGEYTATVSVKYVNPNQPDVLVGSKTRMKRIEVRVVHHQLKQPVTLYYYACY